MSYGAFLCLTHSYSQRTAVRGPYQVRNPLTLNDQRIRDPSSSVTSGTCTTTTITNWVKTMSVYIKCLDGNHLVGLGDEGWFNCTNSTDGAYEYVSG